jgi:flavodoxin
MPKAAVVYHSRSGTTRALAEEIAACFTDRKIETRVLPIWECTDQALAGLDYLLLGCWTHGLMIILQHPEQPWVDFAHRLPPLAVPRVGLFTTYKLATGSMFRKMRKHLQGKIGAVGLELKSRNGQLSGRQRQALERFITDGTD